MDSNDRISYRNSLPQVLIWDFSSSSEEDIPVKKIKIEPQPIQKEECKPESSESESKEYGPTFKNEVKPLAPKLLEQLGYVNRNARPPNSSKNEILPSLDMIKPNYNVMAEEKATKEQDKINQIKNLIKAKNK
ncbi:hypothetical protein SteCoe_38267 [Stentor coeruleus]|uniref:Uncharacterized protein n=1 Tax=Stentor coeruleus TaxID=5963 RepID=A0A1R2ALX0_9CILI|nr:hypothetical protein SteCoe_38267 [Stentor coeruleus]